MIDLPPASITGIGSLPHTDPVEAARFVSEVCPEVPFWPQLPNRDRRESMVPQALAGLQPALDDSGARARFRVRPDRLKAFIRALSQTPAELDRDHAAGFFAFKNALAAGRFPHAVALKGQVLGPITLASHVFLGDRSFARDADLTRAITARISSLIRWQADRLGRQERPLILFVDEPGLAVVAGRILDEDFAHLRVGLALVLDAVREAGATPGLHCCGAFPFSLLEQVKPEILSFDAWSGMEGFGSDARARAFVESENRVAYGLVPSVPPERGVDPGDLLRRWKEAIGANLRGAARRSMLTASCGLASASVDSARASFRMAVELAASLRASAAAAG
jgi:hypothetical protein